MGSCSPENRSAAIQHGPLCRQDFLLFMPYDLIAVIFSPLTANELVVCASVCQRWRSFFNDNPQILWKKLLFRSIKQFFGCPAFIGEPKDWRAKHIRSFSFDHSQIRGPYTNIKENEMATVFNQLIETDCSYLEHLEIYDCPLSHMGFVKYISFIGERLRNLDISNSYIDPRMVGAILNACPNLSSLEFQDCIPYASSTFSLQPVATDMPSRHLVTLQIVVDETIGSEYLGRLLRNCPQLKTLTLNSQVDWIVRDAIDRPPPEIIFDAIYDAVQQSCTVLESFTFVCIPYWTIAEHSHITHRSPASLQNVFALSADVHEKHTGTKRQMIRHPDVSSVENNAIIKRKYATLEYYVGCPPPQMKNRSWTMLSIAVDTDVARVGYRGFPFTLGSVRYLFRTMMCMLEEVYFVRLDFKDLNGRVMQEEGLEQQQKTHTNTATTKRWIIGLSLLQQLKYVKFVHCTHVTSKDMLELVEQVKGITVLHILGCEYLGDIGLVEKSLSKRNGRLIMNL
ncbi:hypothetical protein BDB00DRAFT_876251 [Zychaea mexicana]|uniref:uncharacterized protein n=1 Tax=Zychaea mexicana TaxID=64656 RepID=UPI0022FE3108|nr:uncharacterized protein BDB00DRAFT_876251 [Zychaea mexicana]KAI9489594.1 hypothetical protein BDB00DRAFT_876251 [Zychaea mexicana]